jgi:urease accessory protein
MIKLTEKTDTGGEADATLTLPLHERIKCRLRVTLDNGRDAGVFLARGATLKDGDLLRSEDGYRVRIRAAAETLSCVRSADPHLLARACYHLGNRHVSIQIEPDRVCYPHDHVLDDMLRGFGMTVEVLQAAFEPEPGAYGGSAAQGYAHHHHHDHAHHH